MFSKIFTTKHIFSKIFLNIYWIEIHVKLINHFTFLNIMYLLKYSNNIYLLFTNDFIKLLETYPLFNLHLMGLPDDYKLILDKYINDFLSD